MKQTLWVFPTVAALALGLGIHFGMDSNGRSALGGRALPSLHREAAADERPIATAVADLRRELVAVKAEMAEVRALLVSGSTQGGTRRRSETPQDTTTVDRTGVRKEAKALSVEESVKLQETRLEAIESGFRSEPTDDAWAAKVTDLVKAAVAEKAADGNDLRELECRSTVCRVEVFHQSLAAKSGFLQMFALKVGSELPQMTIQPNQAEDGTSISRIYLARSGHDLPPLDPENRIR